jgi:hypothetical protein
MNKKYNVHWEEGTDIVYNFIKEFKEISKRQLYVGGIEPETTYFAFDTDKELTIIHFPQLCLPEHKNE